MRGNRVLVTRAPHQASDLAEHLRALGLEPVLVPAIELVPPTSFATLDQGIAELRTYDWLLFTSANAVEVFGAKLALQPFPGTGPTMPHIAAIGAATVRALAKLGLTADLVPPQAVAESLTAALLPQARRQDGTAARLLLVRAEEARETLPETLREHGAEVVIAPAYRNVIPEHSKALLQSLFEEPGAPPDAITFTSSSSARNLVALFQAAGVRWPITALRVSIGPITTQTLQELGFPPHAESPEASVVALAQTVSRALLPVGDAGA